MFRHTPQYNQNEELERTSDFAASRSRGTTAQASRVAAFWGITSEQSDQYDLEMQEQLSSTAPSESRALEGTPTFPRTSSQVDTHSLSSESFEASLAQDHLINFSLSDALQLLAEEQQSRSGHWLPVEVQGISLSAPKTPNQAADALFHRYQPDFVYPGPAELVLRPPFYEEMWVADVPPRRLLVSVSFV